MGPCCRRTGVRSDYARGCGHPNNRFKRIYGWKHAVNINRGLQSGCRRCNGLVWRRRSGPDGAFAALSGTCRLARNRTRIVAVMMADSVRMSSDFRLVLSARSVVLCVFIAPLSAGRIILPVGGFADAASHLAGAVEQRSDCAPWTGTDKERKDGDQIDPGRFPSHRSYYNAVRQKWFLGPKPADLCTRA